MTQSKIDRKWSSKYKTYFLWAAALLAAFVLVATCFKGCTQFGRDAKSDVYTPESEAGFIGNANKLFRELLNDAKERTNKAPKSLEELNLKYAPFTFAFPENYKEGMGGRVSDLRLVDIHTDAFMNESQRKFYNNSVLPNLLMKQRQNMGTRIFNIKFEKDSLDVKSIELVPSMFRVALEKDPWQGTIMAADNSLFPESKHCFIVWGKNMMPIRMASHAQGNFIVTADKSQRKFMRMNREVDYYTCFQEYNQQNTMLIVNLGNHGKALKLEYLSANQLRVKVEGGVHCHVVDSVGNTVDIHSTEAGAKGEIVPFQNDLKLIITNRTGEKQNEFVVSHHNPMLNLSLLVNSNSGKSRFFLDKGFIDLFTQQMVTGLSSTLRNSTFKDTVQLTVDPMLSLEFEREMQRYCETVLMPQSFAKSDDIWEMSLTVMDMATGNVVAAPFYCSANRGISEEIAASRKNPALMRRYVGSTFKPLLALAAVQTTPSLIDLNTVGKYRLLPNDVASRSTIHAPLSHASFYGTEIDAWSLKAPGFWNGSQRMGDFLAKSDDVYPVALTVLSMMNESGAASTYHFGNYAPFTSRLHLQSNTDQMNWTSLPLFQNIDRLYDVKSYDAFYDEENENMLHYIWRGLRLEEADQLGLDLVNPDPTVMYYDHLHDKPHTLRANLVPWVLGQGSNEWNCVKLAEAWTRMLTKRAVRASLIRMDEEQQLLTQRFEHPQQSNQVWNRFLNELQYAQSHSPNLLTPMNHRVEELNKGLVLFSKTGTPENYDRQEWRTIQNQTVWLDLGLYCMALMPSTSFASVQKEGKARGVMCVIRVTRLTKHRPSTDGVSSSHARNFFSSNPVRLKKFYDMTKMYY